MAKNNATFFHASSRRCGRCANWSFDRPRMKVSLPDEYLETCHLDSPPRHRQRKLDIAKNLYSMILILDN